MRSSTSMVRSMFSGFLCHLQTPLIPPLSKPFWQSGAVCRSISTFNPAACAHSKALSSVPRQP